VRLAFRTAGFRGWEAERTVEELAAIGYHGAELCLEAPDLRPETITEERCQSLRRHMDRLNIAIASVSYHGDGEPPEQRAANQLRSVQVAAWFGADVLVLNSEKAGGDREAQWSSFVEHVRKLAVAAETYGVYLAFEPEPLLLLSDTASMLALIKQVGSPRVAVNLDIGHCHITDRDVPASIRRLGRRIVHTHIEDIRDNVHQHLIPGQGNLEFKPILSALRGCGYRGYFTIDLFNLGDDAPGVARASLEALQNWR
jgi:sugar phosphate isomerase/epimerase